MSYDQETNYRDRDYLNTCYTMRVRADQHAYLKAHSNRFTAWCSSLAYALDQLQDKAGLVALLDTKIDDTEYLFDWEHERLGKAWPNYDRTRKTHIKSMYATRKRVNDIRKLYPWLAKLIRFIINANINNDMENLFKLIHFLPASLVCLSEDSRRLVTYPIVPQVAQVTRKRRP